MKIKPKQLKKIRKLARRSAMPVIQFKGEDTLDDIHELCLLSATKAGYDLLDYLNEIFPPEATVMGYGNFSTVGDDTGQWKIIQPD